MKQRSVKDKIKMIYKSMILLSVISLLIALACFIGAYYKKNVYYNSEEYPEKNRNAYVGGDAYNYIINSGYFSGYCAAGAGFTVSSSILFSGAILTKTKLDIKEYNDDVIPPI